MFLANNEKQKTKNNGKNRTTKSRQNNKARRKRNLPIIGNIGSGYHLTSRDKKKELKKSIWENEKTKLHNRNLIKGIKTWIAHLRILKTILKVDEKRTSTNGPVIKKTHNDALHHRSDVDRLYVSRKEGGKGFASIQDASIQRLGDYKNRAEED